jgi:outer membrane receptor protein involved in Fe transport
MPGQNFEGEYIINFYRPENWKTEMLSVSGSVSKGIELINGTIALYPNYVHSTSRMLRNNIILPYASDSYSVRGMVTSKVASKCNLTYQVSYTYNKNQMEGNQSYFSSVRFSESLKATYFPVKSLQLSYTLDHYCNELSANNYKHFIFSDVSASYLLGNRWELTSSVKNIFNEKSYSYFIENELTSFYQSYKIRPRNLLLSATYRF